MKILRRMSFLFCLFNFFMILFLIIRYISRNDLIAIFHGVSVANKNKDQLVDISYSGTKYVALKTDSNSQKFDDMIANRGFEHIIDYGRSAIYEVDGIEHVIKRSVIFGQYFLFEVF